MNYIYTSEHIHIHPVFAVQSSENAGLTSKCVPKLCENTDKLAAPLKMANRSLRRSQNHTLFTHIFDLCSVRFRGWTMDNDVGTRQYLSLCAHSVAVDSTCPSIDPNFISVRCIRRRHIQFAQQLLCAFCVVRLV